MTDYSNLVIRPLDSDHDRLGFHCGVASLDDYSELLTAKAAELPSQRPKPLVFLFLRFAGCS